MIAAVVLAAGASRRLGEPKQLVKLDPASSENLLERTARIAREAGCGPVIVVVGCEAASILSQSSLGDSVTVVNGNWPEGMASSIRLGVETCRLIAKPEGILLLTCDQPAVTAQHLQTLASAVQVTASEYAGRKGVPAYFPAAELVALLTLTGDAGARDLLRAVPSITLPHGELDIDTPADLAQARKLFGPEPHPGS